MHVCMYNYVCMHVCIHADPVQYPSLTLLLTSSENVTSGDTVCSNIPTVEFTCIGLEVIYLEWQRNGMEIINAEFDYIDKAPVVTHSGPFTVFLDAVVSDKSIYVANITSRLTFNITDMISQDQISCRTNGNKITTMALDFSLKCGLSNVYSACIRTFVLSILCMQILHPNQLFSVQSLLKVIELE